MKSPVKKRATRRQKPEAEPSRKVDAYWIPVLAKALDVLECFNSSSETLTLEQVVRRTGIAHTTAYRVLHTLAARNYVTVAGKKYQLNEFRRKIRIGFANLSKQVSLACEIEASLRLAVASERLDLLIWDNNRDAETAIRNAEAMVAAKVDVGIEFQLFESVAPIIAEILAGAGIPLISLVNPHHGTLYFGVDNYRAGHSAGTALAEFAANHWKAAPDLLILLESPNAGRTVRSRMVGVQRAIEQRFGHLPAGAVHHADGAGEREASRAVVRNIIRSASGKRVAVAGINDESAIGAVEAVRGAASRVQTAIVGHGGSDEIRALMAEPDSPCIGTVLFHPERYGPPLAEFAIAALKGRVSAPAQYVPHEFLSQDRAIAAAAVRDAKPAARNQRPVGRTILNAEPT